MGLFSRKSKTHLPRMRARCPMGGARSDLYGAAFPLAPRLDSAGKG
jgi:hypothetical protein